MAYFELNKEFFTLFNKIVVPCIITKRTMIVDLDSEEKKIFYDFKHNTPSGFTFSNVEEEELKQMYREAMDVIVSREFSKK